MAILAQIEIEADQALEPAASDVVLFAIVAADPLVPRHIGKTKEKGWETPKQVIHIAKGTFPQIRRPSEMSPKKKNRTQNAENWQEFRTKPYMTTAPTISNENRHEKYSKRWKNHWNLRKLSKPNEA